MPDAVREVHLRHTATAAVPLRPAPAPLRSDQSAALRLYLQAVAAYEQAAAGASAAQGALEIGPLERIARRVVDAVHDDAAPLLGLCVLKGLKTPPGRIVRTHGVNTMVLAVTLAGAAGMARQEQVRVALSGLLHDLGRDTGMAAAPHGIATTHALLRFRAIEDAADCAVTALCHDAGIAPVLGADDAAPAAVRIADAYDVLTGREGVDGSPDAVLVFLLRNDANRFDPALVRCLARTLGMYPPGTTVQLDDGRIGVVVRPAPAAAPDAPLVRVCCAADGTPAGDDVWARPEVRIVSAVDPAAFGVDRERVFVVR